MWWVSVKDREPRLSLFSLSLSQLSRLAAAAASATACTVVVRDCSRRLQCRAFVSGLWFLVFASLQLTREKRTTHFLSFAMSISLSE
jgi:hypothetical protein